MHKAQVLVQLKWHCRQSIALWLNKTTRLDYSFAVEHPISLNPILFSCGNAYPSGGTITFPGTGGSIPFRGDDTSYDDIYTTETGGTGTFPGGWSP